MNTIRTVLAATLLVMPLGLAGFAYADEPGTLPPPANTVPAAPANTVPAAPPHLEAFSKANPQCRSIADGCVTCAASADGLICSLPAIACIAGPVRCTDQPEPAPPAPEPVPAPKPDTAPQPSVPPQ